MLTQFRFQLDAIIIHKGGYSCQYRIFDMANHPLQA